MEKIKEEWRPVKGYEGLYEVCNYGLVKSLGKRKTIMKIDVSKCGYAMIHLYKNGSYKRALVHRLVAEAFIPNPDNLPQVNHKDENKLNNRVDNLEWCTASYNSLYGTKNERHREKMINNPKRSKPVIQKEMDGTFVKRYPSIIEAERNGFVRQCITKVCNGESAYHYNYLWEWA